MRKLASFMCAACAAATVLAKPQNDNGIPAEARPDVAEAVAKAAAKPHPRLFADAAGFADLKERIGKDGLLTAAAEHVRAVAGRMLPAKPSERIKQGKRLLGVSRTALYRIATLAMAYRLYGDKAHIDRAVAEMRAVCAFEDWNPSHFLDVGEMSLAVAVGYDWLYADLDEATRKEISAGLRRCGLEASLQKLGWIQARNNWGQVCHAGILSAALALAEENAADAARYVQRCIDKLPISMKALAPNGCYPEGPGYWSYGMHFNVIAIALLEGALGSDFGLASRPGFREAGYYPDIVTGPSGQAFNYADGGGGVRGTHPALWWFAKRFKSPDILRYRELAAFKEYAARRDKGLVTKGHRLFPFALFWLEMPSPSDAPSRLPLVWDGQGPVPITIQRSSWNDDEALFVGLKGGSPSGPHGHMDGGSFVMDTKDIRWAVDLGAEGYYGIERRGMNLWNSAQDSDRWKVFRLSTWSHNVPMIDGCQQWVKGSAKVMEVKRDGASSEVTLDLSSLYTNATTVVRKGAMASDGRRYMIRDTFAGVRPGASIRWAMMTTGEPTADGDMVTLRRNGKTLTLTQCGAQKGEWTVLDGQGPNEWDSKNSGCRQLIFTVPATAEGTADIAVKFAF
ncbi:MAG: heparinase II/III family protein [Kiritimatiellae bacterium]|nr:heparinase II/III family protein [Kiritimatiellia bacterium]